jgi:hypothetical protein
LDTVNRKYGSKFATMRQAGDDGQTGSERFAPLLLTQVFRAQATPTIVAIYYD